MKTVTADFDKIILLELFPVVPRAFQVLAVELNNANLRWDGGKETEIMLQQAELLKDKLSHYIDRQVDASIKIFKKIEKVVNAFLTMTADMGLRYFEVKASIFANKREKPTGGLI